MKLRFGMPLDPSHYAWELVKRLGFKEPSIDWVDIVLEHLGLRRESYSGALFFPSSQEPTWASHLRGLLPESMPGGGEVGAAPTLEKERK